MAMELAGDNANPGQLSRVHNIIGVVAEDPAQAAEHLDEALELAGDDDLLRLAGLNNRAHLTAEGGDLEGAIEMVSEAVRIAQRTGNRHREAALHDHLADLHHRAGRDEEAQQALTQAVSLFSGIGTGEWHPEVWLLSRW
jgi:tetratricopeptide (TPR) repeat protein